MSVDSSMRKGQSTFRLQTVSEVHHQIILVLHRVVLEDETVLSRYPDFSLSIYVQLAEVGEVQNRAVSVGEYVVAELFAVISVYSFLGKKPHIAFLVFFYCNHSPATETLLGVQVSIELCGSRKKRQK